MATHSSTLAWRIPWTEDPGELQSMVHKESDTTEATEHSCIYYPKSYQEKETACCCRKGQEGTGFRWCHFRQFLRRACSKVGM